MAQILSGLSQAIVNLKGGGTQFVRKGEPLPDDLKDGEEERLAKLGAFDPFPERVYPEGTVVKSDGPQAVPQVASDNPASVAGILGEQTPPRNASLGAWRDYALSRGASEADLENLGRDELRDLYGS